MIREDCSTAELKSWKREHIVFVHTVNKQTENKTVEVLIIIVIALAFRDICLLVRTNHSEYIYARIFFKLYANIK